MAIEKRELIIRSVFMQSYFYDGQETNYQISETGELFNKKTQKYLKGSINKLGYKAISLTGWQAGILTNNTNQNAISENDMKAYKKYLNKGIEEILNKAKYILVESYDDVNPTINREIKENIYGT